MDTLKNQIVDKIIILLEPLKTTYKDEIDVIINDLTNNKFDSLIKFVNTYFSNLTISNEVKDFVKKLINAKLIDESFEDKLKDSIYQYTTIKGENILLEESKPLNVKKFKLNNIRKNTPTPNLIQINHKYSKVSFAESDKPKEIEIKQDKPVNIDDLRKKIFDAQLVYLNDALKFIKDLETKDEIEMYESLINLNDIRYIQHSLSKLSQSALYRLLPYVENKLKNNKHYSIDMFIIEVIKKYLHTKML